MLQGLKPENLLWPFDAGLEGLLHPRVRGTDREGAPRLKRLAALDWTTEGGCPQRNNHDRDLLLLLPGLAVIRRGPDFGG
jgi:hypothetical protein